jgi:DNA invertase Pin-like site-specific DNA recombinase
MPPCTSASRCRIRNPALQVRELEEYAARQGWEIAGTYSDVISGAKGSRPGLDGLMAAARRRRFGCVLVWKLDRFGRSLVDCLNNIQALESCGVRFIAVTQGLDTDQRNPASRFLLQVLGAAAEFERSLIVERSRAGQARYRRDYEAGKVGKTVNSRSGKNLPPHRPRKVFDRRKVAELRSRGLSLRRIAQKMGIGLGTVTRALRESVKP